MDNLALGSPSQDKKAATDEVQHGGDTNAHVELVRLVSVSGEEGGKFPRDVNVMDNETGLAILAELRAIRLLFQGIV